MIILFAGEQLRTECELLERLVKKYGAQKARRIRQRLDELDAARNLADFRTLPAVHCEQVNGQAELISVSTIPPARILLRPANSHIPRSAVGGLNWQQVTVVQVISLDEKSHD